MNWGEFKKLVEEKGVTDETEIQYIDVGSSDSVEVKVINYNACITD